MKNVMSFSLTAVNSFKYLAHLAKFCLETVNNHSKQNISQ